MRTIKLKTLASAEEKRKSTAVLLRNRAKRMGLAHAYLHEVHKYVFVIGGAPTAETSEMMGEQAKLLNLDLQRKYARAVSDAYPGRTDERLCRWCVHVDPKDKHKQRHHATVYRPRSEDKCELPKGLQYGD